MCKKYLTKLFPVTVILIMLFSACTPMAATTAVSSRPSAATATVSSATPAVSAASATIAASATTATPVPTPQAGDQQNGTPSGGNPPDGNPPSGTPPADMGGGPGGGNPPSGTPPAGMGGDSQGGGPGGGNPPSGTPPADMAGGNPGGGNPPSGSGNGGGNPPGGSGSSSVTLMGAYTVDGTTESQAGQTYTGTQTDQSAIYVLNGGNLTLKDATITSSGGSSSSDSSSFYGLNAGVLAASGSTITMSNSTVTTTGDGANGVFANGEGTTVTISDSTIDCIGQYAHAVMATLGGTLIVNNVNMTTAGGSSGAIATDRGSGTITVTGGNIKTTGNNSPGIYSTGKITVTGATILSTGSEAAVIEGANSIILNNTSLTSSKEDKWGVMIYQSFSGDAEGTEGTFTMNGGSLAYTATSGPLFYVTNSTGIITLKGATLTVNSGVLVKASAGNWGNSGSNGGTVILTADGQALNGNLVADNISSITLTLQNSSSLSGAINSEHTARSISVTLDASSNWNLTADSYVTTLNGAAISGTSITNISGNGHTIYYDSSANPSLGGATYTLANGGYLKPAS